MPNLEEHCKHSKERYSFEGKEIHQWLDEPSRVYGGIHRGFRHDEKTIILAGNRFGKNYGEGIIGNTIAQQIALDHIILDQQESLKKRTQETGTSSDAEAFERIEEQNEKPYEQKKRELKKIVDEYSKLPKVLPQDMSDYLEAEYATTPDLKSLAETSLRHWYQYLLTRNNSNTKIDESDVFRFVSQFKKKVNATSRSNYYGRLIPYFKYAYDESLSKKLQAEKKNTDKEKNELKKNLLPLRIRDVRLFYQKAKLPDKIAIRILLLEDISIDNLVQMFFIPNLNGQYHFQIMEEGIKKEIIIDSDTAKLALPLMQKSKNGTLFGWRRADRRNLDDRFQRLSERLGLTPNITPQDLSTFGRNHHPDDLKELLSDKNTPIL